MKRCPSPPISPSPPFHPPSFSSPHPLPFLLLPSLSFSLFSDPPASSPSRSPSPFSSSLPLLCPPPFLSHSPSPFSSFFPLLYSSSPSLPFLLLFFLSFLFFVPLPSPYHSSFSPSFPPLLSSFSIIPFPFLPFRPPFSLFLLSLPLLFIFLPSLPSFLFLLPPSPFLVFPYYLYSPFSLPACLFSFLRLSLPFSLSPQLLAPSFSTSPHFTITNPSLLSILPSFPPYPLFLQHLPFYLLPSFPPFPTPVSPLSSFPPILYRSSSSYPYLPQSSSISFPSSFYPKHPYPSIPENPIFFPTYLFLFSGRQSVPYTSAPTYPLHPSPPLPIPSTPTSLPTLATPSPLDSHTTTSHHRPPNPNFPSRITTSHFLPPILLPRPHLSPPPEGEARQVVSVSASPPPVIAPSIARMCHSAARPPYVLPPVRRYFTVLL
ncbi:hypothetical protein C7M84_020024 [Penaeus vannamei]|uniref:Uncharacterized protein n=1 Tax=Penaeus vannamei TaxID=6689 RepID=A0A3R7LXX1_PENVA|nr:hypothetical protein C7M84_020024 [Penaeus vannamei]